MSTPKGFTPREAAKAASAIQRAGLVGGPKTPNARCNKCGAPLRANAAILDAVRTGFVDHTCGGQFIEIDGKAVRP